MTDPVTLDPAFVESKRARLEAILESTRNLDADQLKTCVIMRRNVADAHGWYVREQTDVAAAESALASVGLLAMARETTARAITLIPAAKSPDHRAGMATAHYVRNVVLGVLLDGLTLTDPNLIARLTNPWRTLIGRAP